MALLALQWPPPRRHPGPGPSLDRGPGVGSRTRAETGPGPGGRAQQTRPLDEPTLVFSASEVAAVYTWCCHDCANDAVPTTQLLRADTGAKQLLARRLHASRAVVGSAAPPKIGLDLRAMVAPKSLHVLRRRCGRADIGGGDAGAQRRPLLLQGGELAHLGPRRHWRQATAGSPSSCAPRSRRQCGAARARSYTIYRLID